jgi:hypothetical protein
VRVIAKGYADKPYDQTVVEEGEKVIYVASASALCAVGATEKIGVAFPRSSLFKFDEAIAHAWCNGDKIELKRLWDLVTPAYPTKRSIPA